MTVTKTKSNILKAAEELISEKGIAATTISAIAAEAGVADSLVYQYFKNKEGLLFAVAEDCFSEAVAQLEEHLAGIRDPWARLEKMVWYSLRYNDRHPGYVRILLFECRSNQNFYRTPAYRLMRRHAGILRDILDAGVQAGAFRRDANTTLLRDILYGTFDFEAIGRLAIGEVDKTCEDLEDILSIMRPMLCARPAGKTPSKEAAILAAAEKIFSRDGYMGTKVAEIAKQAQVAEGTVYEYFGNKESLLLSIPARRFRDHLQTLPETFHIRTPLRKLRRLIRYHFSLFLPNRDFLKVFLLDTQLNIRFYRSEAFDSYRKYFSLFEQILEEGQADGSFRSDIQPRVFRTMFLGAFSHMALRWVILNGREEIDKMREIDQIVDLFSEAVLPVICHE